MMRWYLIIPCLNLTNCAIDQEWISVPGKLYACEGQGVIFDWQFNETYGTPDTIKGVLVTKKDPTITYLTKTGGANASLPQGRTETHGNAGIKLLNVNPDDTANFECSVYFTEKHQVHNDASLKVYASADCPDEEEYMSLPVSQYVLGGTAITDQSRNKLDIRVQTNSTVWLGVHIPRSNPIISAVIEINGVAHLCNGSAEHTLPCGMTSAFPRAGSFHGEISTNHVVYGKVRKTIDVRVSDYLGTSASSGEAASTDYKLIIIFAILAFLAIVTLVCVYLIYKKSNRGQSSDMKMTSQQPA